MGSGFLFSLVRFEDGKSRIGGDFSRLCSESYADFSALQTVQRRERNSNPRYPFVAAKRRPVRKLQIQKAP
jgi:hypothetical protein